MDIRQSRRLTTLLHRQQRVAGDLQFPSRHTPGIYEESAQENKSLERIATNRSNRNSPPCSDS